MSNPYAKYADPGYQPDPIVKRNAPAPVREEVQQGNILSNQQKAASLAEAPLDKSIKELRLERDALELESLRKERESTGGVKTAESEKTAGFLATRVAGGMKDINDVLRANPGVAKPGIGEAVVGGLFGEEAANFVRPEDRQRVEAAQKDILDAALTLGTGAAYTAEQLDGYRESYFPQLTDKPATIEDKKNRLIRLLEAAKVKAGASAPLIDDALAAVDQQRGPLTVDVEAAPAQGKPGEKIVVNDRIVGFYDADGNRVDIDTGPNFDADGNPIPVEQLNEVAENEYLKAFGGGVGDIVQAGGDLLGLVGNPLNTGINEIFGTNLSTDLGQSARDASGLPDSYSDLSAGINRGGASALAFGGAASLGSKFASGVLESALSRFAAAPGVDALGGAAAGGAASLAPADSPGLQIVAGLTGGIGGTALAQSSKNLAQRFMGQPDALAQAAARQGVDLLPAQAGGTGTGIATAGARQGIVSELPIAKAVERTARQTESVKNRAVSIVGDALDKDDAGEVVRKAADVYSKNTGQTGNNLYTRAFRKAGDIKAPLPKAVQRTDEALAEIAETPGGDQTALFKELQTLRTNMEAGEFSIKGVRNMRSTLREEAQFKGLRGKNSNRIYGDIVDAASEDITDALIKNGQDDAAKAFKTADDFWKTRVETIDEVLEPLLGRSSQRSGEQITSSIERMANGETGNAAQLRRLFAAMPEKEARNVRATIIDRMGKPAAGQQTDETFSLGKFLTDYNKMSGKAKNMVFTGEAKQALDDLAKIAVADKKAGRLLNSSNTARAVGVQAGVSGLAGWFISPLAAGSIAGGQFALGKLLASPKFARWLAKAPKNPAQAPKYVDRLSVIASREPAIAGDAKALQSYLQDSLRASPGRAAAEEPADGGREPPTQ